MPVLFSLLLMVHIAAGAATLLSALVAIVAKLADTAHRHHVIAGRVFFYGMALIFVTALGMSLIRFNVPMLFIAIFSFYFAWMGRRFAVNRRGTPSQVDRVIVPLMLLIFLLMAISGFVMLIVYEQDFGIVSIIFGVIGVVNAYGDWQILRQGGIKGKQRIAEHLGKMLGGTIAAVTAFLVVNVEFEPAFVVWLLPTLLLTPLIVIWSRKIERGVQRKGMEQL